MTHEEDLRWRWWGQTRDAIAFFLGVILVLWDGPLTPGPADPLVIAFAAGCIGITATGILTRRIVGKNGS